MDAASIIEQIRGRKKEVSIRFKARILGLFAYVAITQRLPLLRDVLAKTYRIIDYPEAKRDQILASDYYRHIR